MFLVTESEELKVITKKWFECSDIQLTQESDRMIFSLDSNCPNKNIAIIINGDKPRKIYILSDSGINICQYMWKCK